MVEGALVAIFPLLNNRNVFHLKIGRFNNSTIIGPRNLPGSFTVEKIKLSNYI